MTNQEHDATPAPGARWADRLSPTARLLASLLGVLFLTFLGGAIIGFVTALVEKGGSHKPLAWAVLAALLASFAILAALLWQLLKAWRSPQMSAFDRRYYRMWLVVLAAGLPIGLGLAYLGERGSDGTGLSLFSTGPIDPTLSLLFSLFAVLLLAAASVLYHRTIDDHEERAYLWGSTLAFYFIAAALPVAWLLARGGWIAPVGIGAAFVILLLSFVIQSLAWLWFKYR